MLTLPSGERLGIPSNIRIILEVDSLNFATPATVSRCGMVFFNDNTITPEMNLEYLMSSLKNEDLGSGAGNAAQVQFLQSIQSLVVSDRTSSLVMDALEFAMNENHIMEASRGRSLRHRRARTPRLPSRPQKNSENSNQTSSTPAARP